MNDLLNVHLKRYQNMDRKELAADLIVDYVTKAYPGTVLHRTGIKFLEAEQMLQDWSVFASVFIGQEVHYFLIDYFSQTTTANIKVFTNTERLSVLIQNPIKPSVV